MSHTRCPKCRSGNVIGYMGEWECMDCGHKFRISHERPSPPAPVKPIPVKQEAAYPPSAVKPGNGRGKWIVGIILALIIGLIIGYGSSYAIAPVQTIVNTIYTTVITPTTVEETFTVTQTIPPSTITRYVTETIGTTVITTETVTITTTPSPPPGCEIISGEVTLRHDTPHLYVRFKTPVSAAIKLIGPDGEEKSANLVTPDETAVYLQMSPWGKPPRPANTR